MERLTNIRTIGLSNLNCEKVFLKRKGQSKKESRDEYTDEIFDEETVEKLLKSEADIEAGRTRMAEDVLNELRERFGF